MSSIKRYLDRERTRKPRPVGGEIHIAKIPYRGFIEASISQLIPLDTPYPFPYTCPRLEHVIVKN